MADDTVGSFEDFKNSFSYGSRSDLSFKFLKSLSPNEAADFFTQVLEEIGELYDDTSTDRLIDLVYEWQVRAYQPQPEAKRPYVYEDRPFQRVDRPLRDLNLGLVTSSGHFGADDPPDDSDPGMTQEETMSLIDEFIRRAPNLSEIPTGSTADEIRVRHPGYDVRSAARDPEVALPVTSLLEAERDARIGQLASPVYSFVGACAQGLLRKELDDWIDRWKTAGIQALFLVPV